jgi:hypothetical protein
MIHIKGVKPQDRRRIANAIVLALGIGGVCTREPKCASIGSGDCWECARTKYITFEDASENGGS